MSVYDQMKAVGFDWDEWYDGSGGRIIQGDVTPARVSILIEYEHATRRRTFVKVAGGTWTETEDKIEGWHGN